MQNLHKDSDTCYVALLNNDKSQLIAWGLRDDWTLFDLVPLDIDCKTDDEIIEKTHSGVIDILKFELYSHQQHWEKELIQRCLDEWEQAELVIREMKEVELKYSGNSNV